MKGHTIMKKNAVFGLFGVAVMALSLASCGKQNDEKAIVFWHCLGHDKMRNLDAIVQKFNEEHKDTDGYHVVCEQLTGSYTALHENVMTKLKAGSLASMTMGYPDSFSEYIGSNGESRSRILKLDNFIENDSGFNKEDMVAQYFKEGTEYQYNGTYSVPMYKSTEIMYYNKTAFEASNFYKENKDKTYGDYGAKLGDPATWDWDTLTYVATKIKEEKSSVPDYAPLGYDSDSNLFITQMIQRGIKYTTGEGKGAEHILFMDSQTAKPTAGLTELVTEIYNLTKKGILITQDSYGNYASNLFQQQKVMFTIGSTGGSVYNESTGDYQVALAPVPTWHNTKKYISQGPSICLFNTNNPEKEKATWEFYSKFISDPELNAALALENSYDPVRESSYETAGYKNFISQGLDENGNDALDQQMKYRIPNFTKTFTSNYVTTPIFIGSGTARNEIGSLIGYINSNNGNVEAAIQRAYSNTVQALSSNA